MAKRIKLLRPKRPKTRQQWATYIGNCWHHAVEGVIETGRMLIDAQDNLEHGEFLPMVKNDLPFGEDTAQRLMALARHPVISNAAHARHLPPHWMTLFEMTRLPPKEVADRIANGTINNKTTRKQVRDLRVAATATKATEKKGNVVPLTTKPLPTNVATSKVDLTPPPATVDTARETFVAALKAASRAEQINQIASIIAVLGLTVADLDALKNADAKEQKREAMRDTTDASDAFGIPPFLDRTKRDAATTLPLVEA